MSLYLDAFFAYRFVDSSVQITFDASTGDSALCRLMNHSAECAAGDIAQPWFLDWGSVVAPIGPDAYLRYPDLQLYPTVAAAVVPLYNLNGVTDLVLSLETLAKIWSGRITTWDHPDIQATNPGFKNWNIPTNQPITLVARADTVGLTQVFKQSLAGADAVFRAQVGVSSAPTWNGTQPTLVVGAQLVVARVLRTPFTLGYSAMGDAMASQVPFAKLNRSGDVVEASSDSVEYAMLEKGVAFGDNGDNPAHLTADLFNALNPLAWPIVSYAYLAVRKATLRPGATCATVTELARFWLWFWSSAEVETIAASQGFSVLPTVVQKKVMARFKGDLRCGGAVVWREAETPVVSGYGPGSGVLVFTKFQEAYALVNSSVALNYTVLASDQDTIPYLQAGGFVLSMDPLPPTANAVTLVLAAQAVAGISNYALTLDGLTLAKILNGDITTWLDPAIVALNPDGVRDGAGAALNDTAQRIVLLQGPTARSGPLTALLQGYYPAYTGAAIQAAELFTDPERLWSAVLGTPHSFSISAVVGTLPGELLLAAMVARSGVVVAPTLAAAQACAENATYDPNTSRVTLALDNRSCYPLLLPLYISLQRQCPAPPAAERAVTLLQWMFSRTTLDAALDSLGLVSLNDVSAEIHADNTDALFKLACRVKPVPATPTDLLPLLVGIIIPIVIVLLVGGGGFGWWLWRVTEYNRMLRKKFSNDNVAESCAEAIARFDLQAVAWLREVKEPNKIQRSFLAIVTLLTEVKPYIPDQLLSRLVASKTSKCDGDDEEAATMSDSNVRSALAHESYRRDRRLSLSARTGRSSQVGSPTSPAKKGRKPRPSITSSEGARQLLAMKDWARKRCTYMCVRFGSTSPNAERRLPALVRVAGRIVDVAKENGATIDAVGVDFVAVHWGVASTFGVSAARAVQAGLEIQQLRSTLPEDQQEAFWLQMGIGKGLCDCGTVSSESGHRFFVVWGAEPALALHIAMAGLPQRVLASLLVSPVVHDEVQYTVECMPRLYHGDLLLWEPRFVLRKGDDDEWMYELKKMSDGAALTSKALLDVFLLARDKKAVAELPARIAELRRSHGGTMTPQDTASLELLLAAPRP
eukprot:EG_transcript_374